MVALDLEQNLGVGWRDIGIGAAGEQSAGGNGRKPEGKSGQDADDEQDHLVGLPGQYTVRLE
ncbi:MAG: hypothetical protein QOH59_2078 [Gemmatimonadales bacterium]|nr:hypothetical protein [Gemmatimonadales bacterium]